MERVENVVTTNLTVEEREILAQADTILYQIQIVTALRHNHRHCDVGIAPIPSYVGMGFVPIYYVFGLVDGNQSPDCACIQKLFELSHHNGISQHVTHHDFSLLFMRQTRQFTQFFYVVGNRFFQTDKFTVFLNN